MPRKMAAEQAETPAEITVSRETLYEVLNFFHSIQTANEMYQTCQDGLFRQFARSCVAAPRVRAAFAVLTEKLNT